MKKRAAIKPIKIASILSLVKNLFFGTNRRCQLHVARSLWLRPKGAKVVKPIGAVAAVLRVVL